MKDKRQSLIDYASSLTQLKEYQGDFTGCCPVHQEKTPSFKIYKDGERGICFGCGFHGDVFDLYTELNGGTFLEAKKALGFWDNKPPEKVVGPRLGRNEIEYTTASKKEIYLKCREALIEGRELFVLRDGKRVQGRAFVWECMKDNPDRHLYIYQICLDMTNDNDSTLFYRYFMHQVGLEEAGCGGKCGLLKGWKG